MHNGRIKNNDDDNDHDHDEDYDDDDDNDDDNDADDHDVFNYDDVRVALEALVHSRHPRPL